VASLPRRAPDALARIQRTLGLKLVPVNKEYVAAVSASFNGGLYVSEVAPNSPAARALIQRGDILVGMNVGKRNWETIQPDNILYILDQVQATRSPAVQYYLVRHNEFVQGSLGVADAPAAPVRR